LKNRAHASHALDSGGDDPMLDKQWVAASSPFSGLLRNLLKKFDPDQSSGG
jgi:hypothetical protein